MGNKFAVIGLILLDIILIGICGFFYIQKDRVKPKLSFSANDAVYTSDMDKELLLQGVSANDNVDGVISDRIVIEKILENQKTDTAVVYYAVCDYSGNVNKVSREFKADYTKDEIQPEEEY